MLPLVRDEMTLRVTLFFSLRGPLFSETEYECADLNLQHRLAFERSERHMLLLFVQIHPR